MVRPLEPPHPRGLIYVPNGQDGSALAKLFPTSRIIRDVDWVHLPEWDVLVGLGRSLPEGLPPALFVITFGTTWLERPFDAEGFTRPGGILAFQTTTSALGIDIPADLPDSVRRLVAAQLRPALALPSVHRWAI